MLCDDLDGLDGEEGGREAQEGQDPCILVDDSLCHTAKVIQCCKAIILQLKINKIK